MPPSSLSSAPQSGLKISVIVSLLSVLFKDPVVFDMTHTDLPNWAQAHPLLELRPRSPPAPRLARAGIVQFFQVLSSFRLQSFRFFFSPCTSPPLPFPCLARIWLPFRVAAFSLVLVLGSPLRSFFCVTPFLKPCLLPHIMELFGSLLLSVCDVCTYFYSCALIRNFQVKKKKSDLSIFPNGSLPFFPSPFWFLLLPDFPPSFHHTFLSLFKNSLLLVLPHSIFIICSRPTHSW